MRIHSRGTNRLLGTGFLLAGSGMLMFGFLLWPSPLGKFTMIIGTSICLLGLAKSFVRPRKSIEFRPEIEKLVASIVAQSNDAHLPVVPVLGRLGLILVWVIEVLVLLANLCSGGDWPIAWKCWTVSGLTVLATIYELTLRKRHKIYDQPFVELNHRQSWIAIGLVASYLIFCVWLLWPLPI